MAWTTCWNPVLIEMEKKSFQNVTTLPLINLWIVKFIAFMTSDRYWFAQWPLERHTRFHLSETYSCPFVDWVISSRSNVRTQENRTRMGKPRSNDVVLIINVKIYPAASPIFSVAISIGRTPWHHFRGGRAMALASDRQWKCVDISMWMFNLFLFLFARNKEKAALRSTNKSI